MRNKLLIVLVSFAVVIGAIYLFRMPLAEFLSASLTDKMFVDSDDDEFSAGPEVGAVLPTIRADYQGVEIQDLLRFSGDRGLVIMLNRSLGWCIFCQHQTIDLNEHYTHLTDKGLGLVMLIYDDAATRDEFVKAHGIQYPILSDINVESVKALGVLNEEYEPGDTAYGIPHPGTIVTNPSGEIVGKLFIEDYATRVMPGTILRNSLAWLPDSHETEQALEQDLNNETANGVDLGELTEQEDGGDPVQTPAAE